MSIDIIHQLYISIISGDIKSDRQIMRGIKNDKNLELAEKLFEILWKDDEGADEEVLIIMYRDKSIPISLN